MSEGAAFSLLTYFAEFYEEVASIKLAVAEGRLVGYLSVAGQTPPVTDAELASGVSATLAALLDRQERTVRRCGTSAELGAYRIVQKIMAAVADEVFVLDLEWTGQEAWLGMLLESRLFHTRNAGSMFFDYADRLIRTNHRSELHLDIATVLLLALQLGFQGSFRGAEGDAGLQRYRHQLFQLTHERRPTGPHRPAFFQAYEYCLRLVSDRRMAPLGPWLKAAVATLVAYLLLSGVIWAWTVGMFLNQFGTSVSPT